MVIMTLKRMQTQINGTVGKRGRAAMSPTICINNIEGRGRNICLLLVVVGRTNCEVRKKKRYAARSAAGFAVRLLELVDEWEGSGCSLEPGKENTQSRACGGTQWILVRLLRPVLTDEITSDRKQTQFTGTGRWMLRMHSEVGQIYLGERPAIHRRRVLERWEEWKPED
ncbi:hypothetical protein NQZ68_017504, partial [Dissostichus eleginoides]